MARVGGQKKGRAGAEKGRVRDRVGAGYSARGKVSVGGVRASRLGKGNRLSELEQAELSSRACSER